MGQRCSSTGTPDQASAGEGKDVHPKETEIRKSLKREAHWGACCIKTTATESDYPQGKLENCVQEIIPKRSPRNSSQGLVRRRAYLHCEPITNADANCEIGSQTGTRPGKNHIPERQGESRSRYPILPRMSSKGSGRGEPRHHQQAKIEPEEKD